MVIMGIKKITYNADHFSSVAYNYVMILKNTVILIRRFENSLSLNSSYQNIQQWHSNNTPIISLNKQ